MATSNFLLFSFPQTFLHSFIPSSLPLSLPSTAKCRRLIWGYMTATQMFSWNEFLSTFPCKEAGLDNYVHNNITIMVSAD